jgi:hypothetical protein
MGKPSAKNYLNRFTLSIAELSTKVNLNKNKELNKTL